MVWGERGHRPRQNGVLVSTLKHTISMLASSQGWLLAKMFWVKCRKTNQTKTLSPQWKTVRMEERSLKFFIAQISQTWKSFSHSLYNFVVINPLNPILIFGGGLERWFISKDHLMSFQRTQVQFSISIWHLTICYSSSRGYLALCKVCMGTTCMRCTIHIK